MTLTTIHDLLNYVYNNDKNKVKTFKDICPENITKSDEGYLYEALWKLFFSMRLVLGFTSRMFDVDDLNPYKNIKLISFDDFVKQKIHAGGHSIDILCERVEDNGYVAFSSKKTSNNNEVYNSITTIKDRCDVNNNISPGLILYNQELNTPGDRNKSAYECVKGSNMIFGKNEFTYYMNKLIKTKNEYESFDQWYNFIRDQYNDTSNKPTIVRWFHQAWGFERIKDVFDQSHECLLDFICRSGKSIIGLDVVSKFIKNKKSVLWISHKPGTFTDIQNAINKYHDFDEVSKHLVKQEQFLITVQEERFDMISLQFLKNENKNEFSNEKLDKIKDTKYKLIVIDESHVGMDTDKTRELFKQLNLPDSVYYLYLSGTCKTMKMNDKNRIVWNAADEHLMRELSKGNLKIGRILRRIGPKFIQLLKDNTLIKEYDRFPIQDVSCRQFPQELVTKIEEYNNRKKIQKGVSIEAILELNEEKTGFVKVTSITNLRKFMLKDIYDPEQLNDRNMHTITSEIVEEQKKFTGERFEDKPITVLIYLPEHMRNSNISKLQELIMKEMNQLYNTEGDDVHIAFRSSETCSKGKEGMKSSPQNFINNEYKEAEEKESKFVFFLVGGVGIEGVEYPNCWATIHMDSSINLSNSKKQKMWRARSKNEKNIHMKYFNIFYDPKCATLCLIEKKKTFKEIIDSNSIEDSIKWMYEHDVFHFRKNELINNGRFDNIQLKHIMSEFTYILNDSTTKDNLMRGITVNNIEFIVKRSSKEQKQIEKKIDGSMPVPDKLKEKKSNDATATSSTDTTTTDSSNNEVEDHYTIRDNLITEYVKKELIYDVCRLTALLKHINPNGKSPEEAVKDILNDSQTKTFIPNYLKKKGYSINLGELYTFIMTNCLYAQNLDIIYQIEELLEVADESNLNKLIADILKPSEKQKKSNAEIPTPIGNDQCLGNKMINLLKERGLFKHESKIFEPCAGKGNFVAVMFDEFYEGLKEKYVDKKERIRVIIEKCIYCCELDEINVWTIKELVLRAKVKFKLQDEFTESFYDDITKNIICHDTLTLDVKDKWGIDKFDACICNPPYNSPSHNTGNTLWQIFVETILNKWIKSDGYAVFVHPPPWRKPNTSRCKSFGLYKLLTNENRMLFLSMHDIEDGKKTFGAGTRYDYYIVKNTTEYTETTIVDTKRVEYKMDISPFEFLPNFNIIDNLKIMNKTEGQPCEILYSRSDYGSDKKDWISKEQDKEFKYPCVHAINKGEIRYCYSKVNNKGFFGVSKVIFGNGLNDIIIDMDGKFGMTEMTFGIKVSDEMEANNIKNAMLTKEFKDFIAANILGGSYRIDWRTFTSLKQDFWKEYVMKCPVLHSNNYDPRKPWMAENKNDEFKYPCIKSITKKGVRYAYSNTTEKGLFNIPKVIMSDSGLCDVVIDTEGKYGMTQHGIGIQIKDEEEGIQIKKALLSDKFKHFVESLSYSSFQIEPKLFNNLSHDFWKYFD